MSWPSQGVHEGLDFALYRADDITQRDDKHSIKGKAVSKSLITDFIADPAAWKASPPKKQTTAMKGGSLFDCLLTTPGEIASRYVISPFAEFRSNTAKAWRDEQEAAGIEVVKEEQMQFARAQLIAVMDHPSAAKIINGSQKQVAFRHATKYGFDSKGMIDILTKDPDVIVDLKNCEPGAMESKRSMQRYIFEWSLHIQAGCYNQGLEIATGETRRRFKFIFVTSKAPIRVAVIELPLAAILFGADQYRAGIKRFSECMESDRWPSIWDGEVELDLPEYAYADGGEG